MPSENQPLLQTPGVSEAHLTEDTNTTPISFDASKCSDFTYCLDWIQRRITSTHSSETNRAQRKVYQISHDGKTLLGVADMMFAVGSYGTRRDAVRSWRRLRDREQGGTICPRVVTATVNSNDMDFCTIADFLDYILPHVNGDTAEAIRLARSRTATAVSTGSSLAVALTHANADAIAAGPSQLQQVAEEVRVETEQKLINSGVVPSGTSMYAGNVKIDCQNLPDGNGCYHRVSLKKWIPDFEPSGKMKSHIGKVGMTDSIHTRHKQYGADGAIFETVIIPKAGRRASQCIERVQISMIYPFREYSACEYYNMNAYRDEYVLDSEEEPYAHMLPLIARYIDKVFIAKEVTVTDTLDGKQTTLDAFVGSSKKTKSIAPRYVVTVRYEDLPGWEEVALKPFLLRDSSVEVERARMRAEEARLQTAIEMRKGEEAKLRIAQEERKTIEHKHRLEETTLRIVTEYRQAEEAKAAVRSKTALPLEPVPTATLQRADTTSATDDTSIIVKGAMCFDGGFDQFIATYLERSADDALSVGDVVNLLYTLSGGDVVDPLKLQPCLGNVGYNYDKHLGGEYAVFWGWCMRSVIFDPILSTQARAFIRDRNLRVGLSAWISDDALGDEIDAWGKVPRETLMTEFRHAFTPCAHQTSGLLGLMSPVRLIDGNLDKVSPGSQKLFIRSVRTKLLVHIYENQSTAAKALNLSQGTVSTIKETGDARGGEWLLEGIDLLAEWEKSMILTLAPPVERVVVDDLPHSAMASITVVHEAPRIADAIDLKELRNKGEHHLESVDQFLSDCFVRDETGSVFTTQVTAVYKVWALKAKKSNADAMLDKVKKEFPDKAKVGFGAGLGQRKLSLQGLRLKTIYHVNRLETDFDRFVADRLVVDCIARVHKTALLNEFSEWYRTEHDQDATDVTKADLLAFCANKFIQATSVYEAPEKGQKKTQQPGFLCIGLKGTAANLTGTHSHSTTRPKVTFRSIVTKATIHFPDEREAAVRFNLAPEGIAKLRRDGGLILNRYQEVKDQGAEEANLEDVGASVDSESI